MKVAVIDYGMGNLHSVLKLAQYVNDIGAEIFLSRDPEAIVKADKVILPGQAPCRTVCANLNAYGLADAVRETTRTKPFFGICVGRSCCLNTAGGEGNTLPLFAWQCGAFCR